ncbi:MAG TPA: hypothetical protein VFJ95_14675 [Gammaproteobacteria bacterium]|nr:hypothetical protein [Gammaproteobacteria bacterium]
MVIGGIAQHVAFAVEGEPGRGEVGAHHGGIDAVRLLGRHAGVGARGGIVIDHAHDPARRERVVQRNEQRVLVHRAPVDLRVVPIGVVVHHRHQHRVEAAIRQRDAVVRHEQLLDVRQPVVAVPPLEVLRCERRPRAGMIVGDHVAAGAHHPREELRVPARGGVHVEHPHAGRYA